MPMTEAEVLAGSDRKADRKARKDEGWIQLENHSEMPQHVYDGEGVRFTIPEFEVRIFPRDVAAQFLTERQRFVQKFIPVAIPQKEGMPNAWVANMTGNPFLPSEVEVNRVLHGELTKIQVANPVKTPQTLNFEFGRDQTTIKMEDDPNGDDVINHPPYKFRLPPYQRHKVPADIAMWMQERDGNQDDVHQGKVRLVRAPAVDGFEPNETWDYDDVRIYAALIDDKSIDVDVEYPPEKSLAEDAVPKAKDGLLRALFFRIVDERFALPTRTAFTRAKDGLLKRAEAAAEAKPEDKKPSGKGGSASSGK